MDFSSDRKDAWNQQIWQEVLEVLFVSTAVGDIECSTAGLICAMVALLLAKIADGIIRRIVDEKFELMITTRNETAASHGCFIGLVAFNLIIALCISPATHQLILLQFRLLAASAILTSAEHFFLYGFKSKEATLEELRRIYLFRLDEDMLQFFICIYLCWSHRNVVALVPICKRIRKSVDNFKAYRVAGTLSHLRVAAPLQTSNDRCSICLEEMTTSRKLNCGHLFHDLCLLQCCLWKNACPNCRGTIIFPPPESVHGHGGISDFTEYIWEDWSTTGCSNLANIAVLFMMEVLHGVAHKIAED